VLVDRFLLRYMNSVVSVTFTDKAHCGEKSGVVIYKIPSCLLFTVICGMFKSDANSAARYDTNVENDVWRHFLPSPLCFCPLYSFLKG
jgi:hypothetical protein